MTSFNNVSALPSYVDAVFVANQDFELIHVKYLVDIHNIQSALVVTSHAPFPNEKCLAEELMDQTKFYWLPMSWLLSDSEMEGCDDMAVNELTGGGLRLDMGSYLRRSRFLRNKVACLRLTKRVSSRLCFACDGLGVIREAWKYGEQLEYAAMPLHTVCLPKRQSNYSLLQKLINRLRNTRRKHYVTVVEYKEELFVFLGGSTQRLRFKVGVHVQDLTQRNRVFSPINDINTLVDLVNSASKKYSHLAVIVATTVHNYSPWMLDHFPDIRVFVDGLHPPNYPISYGAYFRGTVIVSREDSDRQWFQKCGCTVVAPAIVLADELSYHQGAASRSVHNVCLMLNHAGDWSALIDRSDTDLVLMTFVQVVARLSDLQFRVRPHPTMTNVAHEGPNSLLRLKQWVESLRLENLQFSDNTLCEDLSWTDCCVSEYSNLLVDCFKAGKPCIALNPTNRRSFLDHLAVHGLKTARNSKELLILLNELNHRSTTSLL